MLTDWEGLFTLRDPLGYGKGLLLGWRLFIRRQWGLFLYGLLVLFDKATPSWEHVSSLHAGVDSQGRHLTAATIVIETGIYERRVGTVMINCLDSRGLLYAKFHVWGYLCSPDQHGWLLDRRASIVAHHSVIELLWASCTLKEIISLSSLTDFIHLPVCAVSLLRSFHKVCNWL